MANGSIGLEPKLNEYLVASHAPEHPVLRELREVTASVPDSRMQIAPEQGFFLAFLVKLIDARNALELGTFTGYSALAVALAMPEDGRVIACDINEKTTRIARTHWNKAGVGERIELRLGPAIETLKALAGEGRNGHFDLAFIDAWKPEYDAYYELTLPLMRRGGVIVLDNMLWGGRVVDPRSTDRDTAVIRALNRKIAGDARVDQVLLPIGDGMMVVRVR